MIPAFLVVDKPAGPTSHDVVGWARRALGTRAIGHSGTLDPFATGVLVLCVGEATKLASYVMAADKEYEATLALGAETDTLDSDGAVVEEAPVPGSLDARAVARAASAFVGEQLQVPPAISAIKEGGVPLHRRARRGEVVAPAPRAVVCHAIDVLGVEGASVRLRVRCGPGFYVRALARDLARALGTRGHLAQLRRTRSGTHHANGALAGDVLLAARTDEAARAAVRAALVALSPASSPIPAIALDDDTIAMLRVGKRPAGPPSLTSGASLAFDADGTAIAIVERHEDTLRVLRGFAWRAGPGTRTRGGEPSEG